MTGDVVLGKLPFPSHRTCVETLSCSHLHTSYRVLNDEWSHLNTYAADWGGSRYTPDGLGKLHLRDTDP